MPFATEKTFRKQLPGAECIYQPPDLADYAEDAWDIRISLGDAPLDEAFYITVEDPRASSQPISRLLEEIALNPGLAGHLATDEYPELPFIQQELLQYYRNAEKGLLTLDVYANNSGQGPIRLYDRADKHMSICVYEDGSWDYRVLDLVFDPDLPEGGGFHDEEGQREYRKLFLLLLLGHLRAVGKKALKAVCESQTMAAALSPSGYRDFPELYRAVEDLLRASLARRVQMDGGHGKYGLELTPAGEEEIARCEEEAERLVATYDCYASVAAAPPALGVAEGFDVRVQMMEYDGLDVEQASMLWVLDEARAELFRPNTWLESLRTAAKFDCVRYVLSFKTNFTAEVLEALKSLAEGGG